MREKKPEWIEVDGEKYRWRKPKIEDFEGVQPSDEQKLKVMKALVTHQDAIKWIKYLGSLIKATDSMENRMMLSCVIELIAYFFNIKESDLKTLNSNFKRMAYIKK